MEQFSFLPTWALALIALGTGGMLGAFWGKIRGFFSSIITFAIADTNVAGNLGVILRVDIIKTGRPLQRFSGTWYRWHRVMSGGVDIPVLQNTNGNKCRIFWYKGTVIYCECKGYRNGFMYTYNIRWLRGTFKIENILKELTEKQLVINVTAHEEKQQGISRYYVAYFTGTSSRPGTIVKQSSKGGSGDSTSNTYVDDSNTHAEEWATLLNKHSEDTGMVSRNSELSKLSLSVSAQDALDDILYWHNNKRWFEEHRVTWKRGYALIGPPGVGKTSLIRGVSMYLDFPVYIFNLASMDNEEFVTFWQEAAFSRPCSIVFEDWDAVFDGRKNISSGNLSFDTLLTCIDGISEDSGILLWLTTNKEESIDKALCDTDNPEPTRPGRIDKIVRFSPVVEPHQTDAIAGRILCGLPDNIRVSTIAAGVNDSPAQFQNRCVNAARDYLWATKGQG